MPFLPPNQQRQSTEGTAQQQVDTLLLSVMYQLAVITLVVIEARYCIKLDHISHVYGEKPKNQLALK